MQRYKNRAAKPIAVVKMQLSLTFAPLTDISNSIRLDYRGVSSYFPITQLEFASYSRPSSDKSSIEDKKSAKTAK